MYNLVFFFFKAEDGIRDLVRSRGLGDVYKRQVVPPPPPVGGVGQAAGPPPPGMYVLGRGAPHSMPVSYTHLTLPTSDLV